MLIDKVDAEFKEMSEIIGYEALESISEIIKDGRYIRKEDLFSWNHMIRDFSKSQALLEKNEFETRIGKFYAKSYIMSVENVFNSYDVLGEISKTDKTGNAHQTQQASEVLYNYLCNLATIIGKINMANELISEIVGSTWEPLPSNEEENNVQNIVISSETRSMSLNDVSSDIGNLDNFFKNVCQLFKKDQEQSNNIYLRRVETGSLVVAVSCAMETAPIIAFIFWCVRLYQKAEKRYLDNADKKLEVINKSINTAKEILKVDPDNKEADEAIQRCGVHLLNFLENNPIGIINGVPYDIGIENLKIEDKEENK